MLTTHTDSQISDTLDRASAEELRFRDMQVRTIQMTLRMQAASGDCLYCDDCGGEIPVARRRAVPGVRRCVHCQELVESVN